MNTSQSIEINEKQLSQFSSDVETLWANKAIQVLQTPPAPIEFLRDYVHLSTPVIIKNAFPIVTLDELIESVDEEKDSTSNTNPLTLNVDVTPDGHGDMIRVVNDEKMFVMPETREMSFHEFRRGLRENSNPDRRERYSSMNMDDNGLVMLSTDDNCSKFNSDSTKDEEYYDHEVLYYSRQNDCLRQELQPLTKHFPAHIEFASEAFAAKPDAINLWIGNEGSVSSMHKDHYENIFCVASGQKIFTICPPADSMFFQETEFPIGTFRRKANGYWIVDVHKECEGEDNQKVHWIESNIERVVDSEPVESRSEYIEQFPLLQYTHPIKFSLEAGDMLYLPALWYHRVTQTRETVAVNYWYDMRFDSPTWVYFNFLQQLGSGHP